MIVIVCLDNNNGMLFNNRRQSRDRKLIENIVSMIGDKELYIDPYSEGLFSNYSCKINSSIDFLDLAGEGDYCFVENRKLASYGDKIQQLIIYKWNRDYPSDFSLDVRPDNLLLSLVETVDFQGFSHERITKEVYSR